MLSRIAVLADRPRHTLGALAVVLAALGVAVGSSANFTAESASAVQTFSAGNLSISGPGAATILSAGDMVPGDERIGVADIQNGGSVQGAFAMDATDRQGSNLLLGQLGLRVRDCGKWSGATSPTCDAGDPTLYNSSVAGLVGAPGGRIALGTWQAGEKHRYEFATTLPAGSGDEYQGLAGSVVFKWYAVAGN